MPNPVGPVGVCLSAELERAGRCRNWRSWGKGSLQLSSGPDAREAAGGM